ncbi:MAG: glucose-1-phosphate adenylyltransferase [Candidatus Latescibacteria bacterium]|nr:glucose-1-phosphate adenylyltransferase [Candidatus Latescibacterota bacterium]
MILAGGLGSRLCLLSEKRAKPAVPFGGKYRIIDFTLSNCVNSGIFDVGILTQYRPLSLRDHIGIGRPWDLDRKRGGVELLQPFQGWAETDWYRGTADAVYQNWSRVGERGAEHILVLSGDHVYRMDYREIIDAHLGSGADATVAITDVPRSAAREFGVVETDGEGRIRGFLEKPESPPSGRISMGVYVFRAEALFGALRADSERSTAHDFGKSILPEMIRGGRVIAFRHTTYWQDIGTLDSYYRANLDLLEPDARFPLEDPRWPIFTRSTEFPPARVGTRAGIRTSIITHGSIVNGTVERSVLFPGAVVEEGAVVRDSIIMGESWVGHGARVDRVILDKRVHVGARAQVGAGEDFRPNRECPEHLSSGITIIGKETRIPEGASVGRNCRVAAKVIEEDFPEGGLASGEVLEPEARLSR